MQGGIKLKKSVKDNIIIYFMSFIFIIITGCSSLKKEAKPIQGIPEKKQITLPGNEKDLVNAGLIKMKKAYPDFIESIGDNYLIWKDGTKMIYDDKKPHDHYEELLNDADLEDQMSMDYPKGRNCKIPDINFDPGRVRNEKIFMKMYGSNEEEVRKNLVEVKWLPNTANKTLLITSVNGVDKKIAAISDELEKFPELLKYIDNPAGSYRVQVVNNSNRLSMHSFGIVIDINNNYSDFWIWESPYGNHGAGRKKIHYLNHIPLEIVEIFEKYGFIWGGKWYHFETIHFEYRPELLID